MTNVLITGGSGSLGNQLTATLLKREDVGRVVIYSRDEFKQSEMRKKFDDPRLRLFIGDVRDEKRLKEALYDIDIVIHAAAMKQVPACGYNPQEAIKTNVLGAQNVISACLARGVSHCMALSTDKACAPVNLYGATKLCSDFTFSAANFLAGSSGTKFSITRYGNVVGSRGSVIPFFKSLKPGEPTPLTDRRMTRFWLTLQSAGDFVLDNLFRMQGGETFIPRIPSVRITDLAQALRPDEATYEVGIRAGEKLHESMFTADDLVIDYDDHYRLWPERDFCGRDTEGAASGLSYRSDKNEFLSIGQILEDV